MRILTTFLLILIVLLGISFAALNSQGVMLHFYLGQRQLPLSLLLAFTLFIGALLGILASMGVCFRLKKNNIQMKHKIKVAETEINNLRAIPIKNDH